MSKARKQKETKGCVGYVSDGIINAGTVKLFVSQDTVPENVYNELTPYYGSNITLKYANVSDPQTFYEAYVESFSTLPEEKKITDDIFRAPKATAATNLRTTTKAQLHYYPPKVTKTDNAEEQEQQEEPEEEQEQEIKPHTSSSKNTKNTKNVKTVSNSNKTQPLTQLKKTKLKQEQIEDEQEQEELEEEEPEELEELEQDSEQDEGEKLQKKPVSKQVKKQTNTKQVQETKTTSKNVSKKK